MNESDIRELAEGLVLDVVDSIHSRVFAHNKSVSKGNGGQYVNLEREVDDAVSRLKDHLVEVALAGGGCDDR